MEHSNAEISAAASMLGKTYAITPDNAHPVIYIRNIYQQHDNIYEVL